jgi:hypothetical protein
VANEAERPGCVRISRSEHNRWQSCVAITVSVAGELWVSSGRREPWTGTARRTGLLVERVAKQ